MASSSLSTRFCGTERALQINTAKFTVCTAGCELVPHNGNFLVVTARASWRPATATFRTRVWLRQYSTTVLPNEAHVWYKRRRFVVAWEGKREHDYGWGILGAYIWITRDRSSFLFLRRPPRLRRELYEVS